MWERSGGWEMMAEGLEVSFKGNENVVKINHCIWMHNPVDVAGVITLCVRIKCDFQRVNYFLVKLFSE